MHAGFKLFHRVLQGFCTSFCFYRLKFYTIRFLYSIDFVYFGQKN